MNILNEIIVIGTQPPCPRCKLLTELTRTIAEVLELEAEIRHIPYTSQEAILLAQSEGLVPGTAKDVAKKAGIDVDWGNLLKSQNSDMQSSEDLNPLFKQYEQLMKDVANLDNALRPFENMAKKIGVLMTPVLIINGEIMHQGSVPNTKNIQEWLTDLVDK